jgi:transcription initiation factor TFIIIB Brf1 subunit/transcription initiation factor TFIIB
MTTIQLPSLEHMSAHEEAQKRMKTVRFIEETCRVLKLPKLATATAAVFFHRFYAKHSFQTHDRFEVAVAAILLAAKTEESPKKLNVVIEEAYRLKQRNIRTGRVSQAATDASPEPESAQLSTTLSLDPKSEEFSKLKERVLLLERVILHTIGFELR